jgi:hypothetical protein
MHALATQSFFYKILQTASVQQKMAGVTDKPAAELPGVKNVKEYCL